ncbi:MAG: topoisomerase DNA-binding C4 zinc finger domain-containing protein [Muribaculaceae bacterium]|nr:topoisomerase DNA-binding C4 zinc finger domain-containing protein [Muribaculaceae bacterium]
MFGLSGIPIVRQSMTTERLGARKTEARESGAPTCPKCGKPMFKRTQKKGQQQGREFWGCSDYPNCNGTRPLDLPGTSGISR